MKLRASSRLVTLIAVLSFALTALPAGTASAGSGLTTDWCVDGNPDACIVSAFRDGVEIFHNDPVFQIGTDSSEINGTFFTHIDLLARYDNTIWQNPVEESHEWTITVNLRNHPAHVAFIRGTEGSVIRGQFGNGDYFVTFTSHPIALSANCDPNAVCAPVATSEWRSYLELVAYDPNWYSFLGMTPDAWDGFNIWTNIDRIDTPPTIYQGTLQQSLASPHFRVDGTTVIEGWIIEELPYSVVRGALFTNDPDSLIGGNVAGSLGGSGQGTLNVTNDAARQLLRLEATGVTFSKRTLTIERKVLPPREGVIRLASRARLKTNVKVSYLRGEGRGSIIIGYQAKCTKQVHGRIVATRYGFAYASSRYVIVPKVSISGTWDCTLRIKSTSGFGAWGSPVRVAS